MNRMALARSVWLGLSVCILVAVSGCSFDVDQVARGVDDAPEELLETPTTESVTVASVEGGFQLTLMFVDSNGQRVEVARPWPSKPTVQDVLNALAESPTAEEVEAHPISPIRTMLPPLTSPIEQGTESGELRVFVQSPDLRVDSNDNPERVRVVYGQIVCSLDALEGNRAETVLLVDEEGPIPAVVDGATVLTGGVGPQDYRDCVTAEELAAAELEAAENEAAENGEETDGEEDPDAEGDGG